MLENWLRPLRKYERNDPINTRPLKKISTTTMEKYIECPYKMKHNVDVEDLTTAYIFDVWSKLHTFCNAFLSNKKMYENIYKKFLSNKYIHSDERKYMMQCMWQFSMFVKKLEIDYPEYELLSIEDKLTLHKSMPDYEIIFKCIPDTVIKTNKCLIIFDYKTSKNAWADDDLIYSKLQWKRYPIALEQLYNCSDEYDSIEFRYIVFPKEGKDKIQVLKTRVLLKDWMYQSDLSLSMEKAVNSMEYIHGQYLQSEKYNKRDTKPTFKCAYCSLKKLWCPAHTHEQHVPSQHFDAEGIKDIKDISLLL